MAVPSGSMAVASASGLVSDGAYLSDKSDFFLTRFSTQSLTKHIAAQRAATVASFLLIIGKVTPELFL